MEKEGGGKEVQQYTGPGEEGGCQVWRPQAAEYTVTIVESNLI